MHYDPAGKLLFMHRVLAEVRLNEPTPQDDVITPPLPLNWTQLFMLGWHLPTDVEQRSLEVHPLNVSRLLDEGQATGEACPANAWTAYWTLR